jgi:signal transduction histidine kinase
MKRKFSTLQPCRRNYIQPTVVLLCLLLCLTMNYSTATAGEIGPVVTPAKGGMPRRKILVIYSQTVKYPWTRKVRDAFEKSLENLPEAERPEVFEEYLDEQRLREDAVGDFVADYFTRKYHTVTFNAVLAETRDACDLLLRHPGLFPGAARYLFDFNSGPLPSSPGTIAYYSTLDGIRSVKTIMDLLPEVHRIVVVGDQSPNHQLFLANLKKHSEHFAGKVTLDFWDNLSVPELYERAAKLPRNCAICYLGIFRDRLGEAQVPAQVAHQLSRVASAPVFGIVDTFLGAAVVGGYMDSAEREGALMARAVLAEDGKPLRLTPDDMQAALSGYVFDDRQLKRWGIPDRRLPKGSVILNRMPTLWQSHRFVIIAVVAAFSLETLLIVTLIRINRKRRHGQELLEEARLTLEQKVVDRTAELVQSKQEADQANHAKSEFLDMISHEYRTPLAIIRTNLDLMTLMKKQDENITFAVGNMHLAVSRLVEILEVSLGRVRLADSALILRSEILELGYLCAGLLAQATEFWPNRRFEIAAGESALITGDQILLRTALLNLLDNAVKYSPPDRPINFSWEVTGGEAVIRVEDQGPGIFPDEQGRLFEKSYRGSAIGKTVGSGLGLWLVARIVEQHFGSVTLENCSTGAVATVRIPVTPPVLPLN